MLLVPAVTTQMRGIPLVNPIPAFSLMVDVALDYLVLWVHTDQSMGHIHAPPFQCQT